MLSSCTTEFLKILHCCSPASTPLPETKKKEGWGSRLRAGRPSRSSKGAWGSHEVFWSWGWERGLRQEGEGHWVFVKETPTAKLRSWDGNPHT